MKKLLALILSALVFCTSLVTLVGCVGGNNGNNGNSDSTSEKEENYLALNAYEITLNVGETFELDAKLYDENNAQQTVKETTYTVDVEQIASVKDGLITAKKAGSTYVNVYADGVAASCYVTVVSTNELDGLIIRFTTQKLYQGVSQQAYALLYDNGTLIAEPTVEWSVEDAETLEVTADGKVTPKNTTDSATITATCEYEGKTYTAEKQIAVVEPVYYALSKSNVKLASPLTVSGATNATYTTQELTLNLVNVATGEVNALPVENYTFTLSDAEVVESTASGTIVQLTAKKVGKATFTATVNENGETIEGTLEVAHAIASVADMDELSLASWNNAALLSESFLMVDDIDYNGDVMMPIAEYDDKNTRSLGIQWKYRLNKKTDENGVEVYEYVDRALFGKKDTDCLTDEEFKALSSEGGLNGNNVASFSGTFDGNGYSIKNGEMFYGTSMISNSWTKPTGEKDEQGEDILVNTYCSAYSHLFGRFTGTLKNVSFENIGMQNPASVTIEGDYGMDAVLENGNIEVDRLHTTTAGNYYHHGASIIAYAKNCVVENVYVEMREEDVYFVPGKGFGAFICWGYNSYVANCVADIQVVKDSGSAVYMIKGKGDAKGTYKNILAIGNNASYAFDFEEGKNNETRLGFNGNYWNKETDDWKTLFTLTAGTAATAAQSIKQTVSTYDPTIWDMENFGAEKDGRPALKKGCSVE